MRHSAAPASGIYTGSFRRRPKRAADRAFARLKADPLYPSLHFKKVGRYWSARVSRDIRAVAVREGDDVVWFWIGTHDEYDRLIG